MGQYYYPILLAETPKEGEGELIRTWFCPHLVQQGSKLTEHAFQDSSLMILVESLLAPSGIFYKTRLVWAGDYADCEPGMDENLYKLCDDTKRWSELNLFKNYDTAQHPFIVNHTLKRFIDKRKMPKYTLWPRTDHSAYNTPVQIHPLALLTAEGNGRGGGDYRGKNEALCGTWARHLISVEKEAPVGYTEFLCEFIEDSGYPLEDLSIDTDTDTDDDE